MNKNLFKICFVAALLISAGSAYASGTSISGTTIIGGGTFSPSNKVIIGCASLATEYSAQAKHNAGDRIIGFNNKDPKMYWSQGVVGSTVTTPTDTAADHTASGWTSL